MNNSTSTDNTSAITSAAEVKPAELKPTEPKPAWGKDMTDPMAVVTEKLSSYKAPALTGLTAQEARK